VTMIHLDTLSSLIEDFRLQENELTRTISLDAEAVIERFNQEREAISTDIRRQSTGGDSQEGFCVLKPRYQHKPGGTHALNWFRLYKFGKEIRSRQVKKPERGADYSESKLAQMVGEHFAEMVIKVERDLVLLRKANRALVKIRELRRLLGEGEGTP